MSVREIERFLEQWQMNVKDLHRRLILAAGPRMDGFGYGAGPGAGSSHHRTMGVGLREGRARSPDLRADRGSPPPLTRRSRRS